MSKKHVRKGEQVGFAPASSIEITTNETDIENESGNMEYHDMEVIAEIEFDSLVTQS